MKFGCVIPVGAGREGNLVMALSALGRQTRPLDALVVVADGQKAVDGSLRDFLPDGWDRPTTLVRLEKHEPGMEQPRNIGTRVLSENYPDVTHVVFLDSDIVVDFEWLASIEDAYKTQIQVPDWSLENRVMVAPYDWLDPAVRPDMGGDFWTRAYAMRNDPRWAMFGKYGPEHAFIDDLSAGLACFSGNLVWPIAEFVRVGGFWSEIHHGRCEDGELGLRAVAMQVPISLAREARGWHLWHPVNTALALERNARDVPMLNERHPWVEQGGVFLSDRDGKAFDVLCPACEQAVHTIAWWEHAGACGLTPTLPVAL